VNTIGIKHLKRIEKLLKSHPSKSYTKTDIRDLINTNYWSIIEVLSYLLHEKKIETIKVNGKERYRWKQKKKQDVVK